MLTVGARIVVGEKMLTEYPEVIEIAKKLNATPAQVLIAWCTKRGYSVIPKSITPGTSAPPAIVRFAPADGILGRAERIVSNFQQVELSDEDYEKICELGRKNPRRYNVKTMYPPFWDINMFNDPAEATTTNKVKIV